MADNVLVTGASGFVGSYLIAKLKSYDIDQVCGAIRKDPIGGHSGHLAVGEIDSETDWSEALSEGQVIVHTAARAHIMIDEVADSLTEYRKVNVEGTLNLARQAVDAGVSRFIYLSSIKVNGERTLPGKPFTAEDVPAPEDHYGISKLEAEQGLQALAAETDMELVIIRPPLVYGPGVKGNFASIMKILEKGWPLPLGAINNSRSLVTLDNLVDLIIRCIDHPAAANQIFLAGDGVDLSTTELIRGIARAMGKQPCLIPVPARLLMLVASLLGKGAVAKRLLGSLQVDIAKTRDLLGWQPPVSVEEGLDRTVKLKRCL